MTLSLVLFFLLLRALQVFFDCGTIVILFYNNNTNNNILMAPVILLLLWVIEAALLKLKNVGIFVIATICEKMS